MANVIVARSGPLAVFQRSADGAVKVFTGKDVANAARFAGLAGSSATASQNWAEGTEPGGSGTDSAKGWATVASGHRVRAGNSVPFATWTALAAATGMSSGDRAQVQASDTGTHTDPVVGGTVNNAGVYTYSASPAGWQRVGDLDSKTANDLGAAQVALATTQAGIATTKAAEAAATAATVGALSSQSLQFPDSALTFAGQFGILKQSRTNMPAILNAADSHVIFCWEAPREKTGRNMGFRLFGNSITGTTNLQFACVMQGTNVSGGGGLPYWIHRNSNVTLNLSGPVIPVDRWVGKVSRTVVGPDTLYTFDAWNTTDGTKYTGTTQTNPAGVVGIAAGTLSQTHWYIGHADTVAAEPTITTALAVPNGGAGGFGLEFLGFYSGAITDTNMQNIALGADPLVELTAANFGYYRRFRGTDSVSLSPVSGTGDTTPATTVLGSVNSGGNLRRQGLANYIVPTTRKPDGFVYGCRKGETGQYVEFDANVSGTTISGGIKVLLMPSWGYKEYRQLNGYVWGRVVLQDGSAWVPWTKIARNVNASAEGLTFVDRSRFAVGIKAVILGQSQVEYLLGYAGSVARTLGRTINGGPGGSIVGKMWDNNAFPIRDQVRVFDGAVTWSDGGAVLVDTLSAAFGCPVCIVNLGVSGTDSREWIKTAGTRLWSDSVTTMALAGTDISCLIWQWYTNMESVGAAFGSTILDATIFGKGASADTNWIGNGLFRQGFALNIQGYTRKSVTTAGPFDTDQNTANIPDVRLAARTWAAANGVSFGPEVIDMQIDGTGGPHEAGTVYGTVRFATRLAESVLRAMGVSTLSDGSLGTPVFNGGKTTITLTATLPNIGGLRVDDTATYAANVQGFEISTNGGTTWSRSGFTAALGATPATRNQVILTKTTGDWTAVAAGQMRVRYAWGGPLAYGTSLESSLLIRGLLYDGCDREGGLGFPIQPMASTVVS